MCALLCLSLASATLAAASDAAAERTSYMQRGAAAPCGQLTMLLERCVADSPCASACAAQLARLASCVADPSDEIGGSWVHGAERSPPRRARLGQAEFEFDFLARGLPVIVTDAGASWAAAAWSYASFRAAAAGLRGEVTGWNMASPAGLALETYLPLLRANPELYIAWTNKRFRRDSLLARGQYSHPYFLPPHLRRPSFEWVYAGGAAGRGAVGHIDILCQCSWALQIVGRKRWWLRSPLKGGESYEFVQAPGEMLFFCPGWWHSTAVESEEGSLSLHAYVDLDAAPGNSSALPLRYARELAAAAAGERRHAALLGQLVDECSDRWRRGGGAALTIEQWLARAAAVFVAFWGLLFCAAFCCRRRIKAE